MVFSWNHELLDQLDFAWNVQFVPRMEDLTDAEYLWEPVDGCLTVRPAGDGTFRLDPNVRASPPPFTTIAWRIGHTASVFGERASNHFGDASFDEPAVRWRSWRSSTGSGTMASNRSGKIARSNPLVRTRDDGPSIRWRRWCFTSPGSSCTTRRKSPSCATFTGIP